MTTTLNDLEYMVSEQIRQARDFTLRKMEGGFHGQEARDACNFSVTLLIGQIRQMCNHLLGEGLDIRKVLNSLGVPNYAISGPKLNIADILIHWFGMTRKQVAGLVALESLEADFELEPNDLTYILPKAIKVRGKTKGKDKSKEKEWPERAPGRDRRRHILTLQEVLDHVTEAVKLAGLTLGECKHYDTKNKWGSHVVDLHDAGVRIVISAGKGPGLATYVLPLAIAGKLMPEFEIDIERMKKDTRVIETSKYRNHSFRLGLAIKKITDSERYDGCLIMDGERVSDLISIPAELIGFCDKGELKKKLENGSYQPVQEYDCEKSPSLYKVDDIRVAAAGLVGLEPEPGTEEKNKRRNLLRQLDKLQLVERNENGIAEIEQVVDGKRKTIKVISTTPLSNRLQLKNPKNLYDLLEKRGVNPIPLVQTYRGRMNSRARAYPLKECLKALREHLFGKDPFQVRAIRFEKDQFTTEIDSQPYIDPDTHMISLDITTSRRQRMMKKIKKEMESHPTALALSRRKLRELYPFNEQYKAILKRELGLTV